MEYILGMSIIVVISIILWHYLPLKWRKFMPYYWLGLATVFAICLLSAPYRIERIISDFATFIK